MQPEARGSTWPRTRTTLGFESLWIAEHLIFPKAESEPDRRMTTSRSTPHFRCSIHSWCWRHSARKRERFDWGPTFSTSDFAIPLSRRGPWPRPNPMTDGRAHPRGWGRVVFRQAVGTPSDSTLIRRGARVDEAIDICRALWSEEFVEHHGHFFDFAPVVFNPETHPEHGSRFTSAGTAFEHSACS